MPPIKEAGKVIRKSNRSLLQQAFDALKSVLETSPDESDNNEEKDTKEAQGFSLNDLAGALGRELSDTNRNAYIIDIFTEDSTCVYQQGWPQKYYQVGYTLDDTGVATFGDPVEVSRKVSYVPTSDNEPPMPAMSMESADLTTSDAQVIPLVEKSVSSDGTVMLKLISPGWGSSGYYSEDVLKRDGPKVFRAGTHNLIDHPTAQEEAARPEGSIANLGSTLIEDAHWLDDFKGNGAGLYARARVVPQFKETLDVIASDIGTSIRAKGKARIGEIDGRKGPIIESIDRALSVDYVTLPGRGGKVIELMESARGNSMSIDETVLKELRETNQKLTEQVMRLNEARLKDTARVVLDRALGSYTTLSKATKERIRSAMDRVEMPLTESSDLDATKYGELLKDAVSKEVAYLASLGIGHVKDLGGSDPTATKDDDYTYEKFIESLKALD